MKTKKSPIIWALGPGTEPYGKYGAVYCVTFMKSLNEGLREHFLGQKPLISPGYTLKLVGKNWIKGVRRAPWSSILFIVKYCCTRALLYAKMLKETESEETRSFVQFLSLVAFQLRGPGPIGPTPWLRLWFWDKIAPLSSFIKKHLKQNFKKNFFSKRGGLESSHLTGHLTGFWNLQK